MPWKTHLAFHKCNTPPRLSIGRLTPSRSKCLHLQSNNLTRSTPPSSRAKTRKTLHRPTERGCQVVYHPCLWICHTPYRDIIQISRLPSSSSRSSQHAEDLSSQKEVPTFLPVYQGDPMRSWLVVELFYPTLITARSPQCTIFCIISGGTVSILVTWATNTLGCGITSMIDPYHRWLQKQHLSTQNLNL